MHFAEKIAAPSNFVGCCRSVSLYTNQTRLKLESKYVTIERTLSNIPAMKKGKYSAIFGAAESVLLNEESWHGTRQIARVDLEFSSHSASHEN